MKYNTSDERANHTHKLVVRRAHGEVVLPAGVRRLLVLDGVQLGAVGDPVAETAAVRAAPVVLRHAGHELLCLRLQRGQEWGHLVWELSGEEWVSIL